MTWYICITCKAKFNDSHNVKCSCGCPNGHTSVYDVETLEKILNKGEWPQTSPERLMRIV